MTALAKIRQAGFSVELHGERLKVVKASKLTDTQRNFIRQHKATLIEQLQREAFAPTALAPDSTDNEPLPSTDWIKPDFSDDDVLLELLKRQAPSGLTRPVILNALHWENERFIPVKDRLMIAGKIISTGGIWTAAVVSDNKRRVY